MYIYHERIHKWKIIFDQTIKTFLEWWNQSGTVRKWALFMNHAFRQVLNKKLLMLATNTDDLEFSKVWDQSKSLSKSVNFPTVPIWLHHTIDIIRKQRGTYFVLNCVNDGYLDRFYYPSMYTCLWYLAFLRALHAKKVFKQICSLRKKKKKKKKKKK